MIQLYQINKIFFLLFLTNYLLNKDHKVLGSSLKYYSLLGLKKTQKEIYFNKVYKA